MPEQVVAVLGAGGWLGRAILRVAATSPDLGEWRVLGVEGKSPLTELVELSAALKPPERPLTVINAVGRRHGPEAALMDSNVRFVQDLATWAGHAGCRVLHVGSAAEYGPGRPEPFSEADMPRPASDYGKTKLLATQALSGLLGPSRSCVARLFNTLGPNPPRGSAAADIRDKMQASIESGKSPELRHPDTIRDFLLLEDAAGLLLDLVPAVGRHQVVNVCSGQGLSWRQITDAVCPALPPSPEGRAGISQDTVVGDPSLLRSLVTPPAPPSPKTLALSLLG